MKMLHEPRFPRRARDRRVRGRAVRQDAPLLGADLGPRRASSACAGRRANILCFRYGRDPELQVRLRERLLAEGRFHLSSTEVHGERWLRHDRDGAGHRASATVEELLDAIEERRRGLARAQGLGGHPPGEHERLRVEARRAVAGAVAARLAAGADAQLRAGQAEQLELAVIGVAAALVAHPARPVPDAAGGRKQRPLDTRARRARPASAARTDSRGPTSSSESAQRSRLRAP